MISFSQNLGKVWSNILVSANKYGSWNSGISEICTLMGFPLIHMYNVRKNILQKIDEDNEVTFKMHLTTVLQYQN